MESTADIKVLFILGFGPIVRDTAESRRLYSENLGIRFKEESGEFWQRRLAPKYPRSTSLA